MDNNTITDGIWLCIEEYDCLIKNEEKLGILERALKQEEAGNMTSGEVVRLANCLFAEA